jgi:hypothetical protein
MRTKNIKNTKGRISNRLGITLDFGSGIKHPIPYALNITLLAY